MVSNLKFMIIFPIYRVQKSENFNFFKKIMHSLKEILAQKWEKKIQNFFTMSVTNFAPTLSAPTAGYSSGTELYFTSYESYIL